MVLTASGISQEDAWLEFARRRSRTARLRLLEMHHRARVGHLGGNLSCLDSLLVLFHDMLGSDDHFILSKGHSAGALYVALWSKGMLTDDDLDSFHADGTLLAGHPPARGCPLIEFATGSLGHGLSLAAGTSLASRFKGETRRVFCLTSDGEWEEGSTWEALIFAVHHRLAALTVMVDANGLQGFGSTAEVASLEPLGEKIAGFGAEVLEVDGHDPAQLRQALLGSTGNVPRIVLMRTRKGLGLAGLEGKVAAHYLPLSTEQYARARAEIEG